MGTNTTCDTCQRSREASLLQEETVSHRVVIFLVGSPMTAAWSTYSHQRDLVHSKYVIARGSCQVKSS